MKKWKSISLPVLFLLLGCSPSGKESQPAYWLLAGFPKELEIVGHWHSYGSEVIITEENWAEYDTLTIHRYSNQDNELYFQNSATDPYNPLKYGRIDWTEIDRGSFYYCISVYGKDSLALVEEDRTQVDSSDPEIGGCGDFPWTHLTAAVP